MDSGWFYIEGPNRHGPLTVEALRAALVSLPDPRRVLVWREGMPDWCAAGQVDDLARVLPPSPPPSPLVAPLPVHASGPHAAAPHVFVPHAFPQPLGLLGHEANPRVDEIVAGARRYRTLVLLVGAQILLGIMTPISIALAALLPEAVFGFLALGVLLGGAVLGVVTAISVYRVADAIDAGAPVLWALLMFVPFLNIIMLLVLSAKAQTWCRRHGVEVGFLGPTESSLARLRAEAS
jgi:hypothetical protein